MCRKREQINHLIKLELLENKNNYIKKAECSKRNSISFNTPISSNVKINNGFFFLNLFQKNFNLSPTLKKISNENIVKIGYIYITTQQCILKKYFNKLKNNNKKKLN